MSSGVGRSFPFSKAIPKSIWIISALRVSNKRFWTCLSPIPKMYPAMEEVATDLVYD